MAEIVGLVVGVVGLAGLIGAFKDTIDLFNDFFNSREFGRDYEILDTKVDIERAILLQWADHVRLLRPDYDRRLDEDTTQRAVFRILSCIKLLMSDQAELTHRYGLNQGKQLDEIEEDHSPSVSGHRMAKFAREFEALKLRGNLRGSTTGLRKRLRWIIRDKEKFEDLVKELAHFTTKLTQIIPIFHNSSDAQHSSNEDIATIKDLRQLKLVRDASAGNRVEITEATRRYIQRTCQDRILRKLWFRTIDDRKESITAAHSKTFHWALETPAGENLWDDLSEWLQFHSGIYWVSGKAGSGKSTLMKHLFHNWRTQSLLSQWAGSTPCSLAHFFFWNLGTHDQKSQAGLSRALLYQILSKHPSLIPKVLPNMWQQLNDTDEDADLPSATETRRAFRVLAETSSSISKFCFFIDGLDEFVGNYHDGIAFLKELAASSHMKIVVSSRPIPDCVSAFEDLPSLRLHHLTRTDIIAYVEDVICGHRYMHGLLSRHPDAAKSMIDDLVNKAAGVFLWVILACRSLHNGFADYDRIHELRGRIDELPPELEDMFQHMLRGISKRHREQGSEMLQLCYATRREQDRREVGDMSSIGLALVDDEYTEINQISTLTNDQKLRLCEELEGRLRSRTGGLLEVQWSMSRGSDIRHCFCDPTCGHDVTIDGRVEFMHRTVFEFLSNEQTWDLECLQPSEGFESATKLSLVGLYSAMLSPENQKTAQATRFLRDGLQWGAQSDIQHPESKGNIFWVMQPFLDRIPQLPLNDADMIRRISKASETNGETELSITALILATEAGAVNFVKNHLSVSHLLVDVSHLPGYFPLLYHAVALPLINGGLENWGEGKDRLGFLSKEMAELMLSYGEDPNQLVQNEHNEATTPWLAWMGSIRRTSLDDDALLIVAEIAEIFVHAGAKSLEEFRKWTYKEFIRRRVPRVRKAGERVLGLAEKLNCERSDLLCSPSDPAAAQKGTPSSIALPGRITEDLDRQPDLSRSKRKHLLDEVIQESFTVRNKSARRE